LKRERPQKPERRITQRKIPLAGSREAAIRLEVEDALRASPEERMRAAVALLDATYELWQRQGLGDPRGLCRFVGCVQERRRGLCRE
jgi:hypothetical protein